MRNPLDLNNFPEDFARDHDDLNHSSPSTPDTGSYRKKKNGGKDESRKVYECRFCSLKFCKSQALGGHMNRHRQERETETLNRARQLVFGNDNLYQLGKQPMVHGGYDHRQPAAGHGCNMSTSLYPTRLFSGTVPSPPPPPPPPPHPHICIPYSSQHSKSQSQSQSGKDYFVCCSSNPQSILQNLSYIATTRPPPDGIINNYTCIGAPVEQGQAFTVIGGSGN